MTRFVVDTSAGLQLTSAGVEVPGAVLRRRSTPCASEIRGGEP
jgi:hypothetical protein